MSKIRFSKNEINKFYSVKERRLREIPVFSDVTDEGKAATADLEVLLSAELAADRNN